VHQGTSKWLYTDGPQRRPVGNIRTDVRPIHHPLGARQERHSGRAGLTPSAPEWLHGISAPLSGLLRDRLPLKDRRRAVVYLSTMPRPSASSSDASPRLSIGLTAGALCCSLLIHGSVPVAFERSIPEPDEQAVEVAVHWVAPATPTPDKGATEQAPPEPVTKKPPRPPTPPEPEPPPPSPEPELADESDVGADATDEAPPAAPAPSAAPTPEPTADEEAPTPEPEQQATDTAPPPEQTDPQATDAQAREASEEASAPETTVPTDAPTRRRHVRKRVDHRRALGQAQMTRSELLARHRVVAEQRRRHIERRARLAKERAQKLADKRKRDQERKLARLKRARAKRKRPPPAELKQGRSDEIWACEAEHRGFRAGVKAEEPITDWVSLVPTVMFTFPTEPGLTGWMQGVSRIKKRDRRYLQKVGSVELALPSTPIEVAFEDPAGTVGRLGRADARCLVGFKWNGKKLWPFTVTRMPAELIDEEGHTLRALVDVTFFEDATFGLKAHHDKDAPLAVQRGRLEGGDFIENTIAGHLRAAKMASSVSKVFGIDLRRFSETGRKQIAYEQKVKDKRERKRREREAKKREREAKKKSAEKAKAKAAKKKRPAKDRPRQVHRLRPAAYAGSDAR
jgi:chemotaxis protein histidine kinase CheA